MHTDYVIITNDAAHTVPALLCDLPTSANGVITVTWSYIHTGGLPLINVSVTLSSDGPESAIGAISISDTNAESVEVPSLVTGFDYTFNVTAVNGIGQSSILCGPVVHRVGEPSVNFITNN